MVSKAPHDGPGTHAAADGTTSGGAARHAANAPIGHGATGREFPFEFDRTARRLLAVLGVTPQRCYVHVDGAMLRIRYGPWRVSVPRTQVSNTQVTGPFSPWKALGPRVSLVDRGLTLGTNAHAGVCISLTSPVSVLLPRRLLTHPAITVTVADPAGLVAALQDEGL
jgi:hypothetical protein